MTSPLHSKQTPTDGIHAPVSYTYADATARSSATGFATEDLYKFAIQTNDNTLWCLVNTSPATWSQVGTGAGSGSGGDTTSQYLVLSASATLTNERVFTPGTGVKVTDAGAGGAYTVSINDSVVATVSGTKFAGNVDLNNNSLLNVSNATFVPVDAGIFSSSVEGRVYYDINDRTLSMQTDISGTNLQIGQEMFVRVRNSSGSPITNGTVVYITGALGNRPTINLADATFDLSAHALGVATHDIANNTDGYITTYGLVHDINTNSWTTNTPLYVSTTPGQLTSTKPTGTNYVFQVGIVIRQSATQGTILVDIHDPAHLSDLHDVLDGSPTSGSYLRGNGTYWITSSFSSDVAGMIRAGSNVSITTGSGLVTISASVSGSGGGISEADHEALFTLAHDVVSSSYDTISYSAPGNNISQVITWSDPGQSRKVRQYDVEYIISGVPMINAVTGTLYNSGGTEQYRVIEVPVYDSQRRIVSVTRQKI